MKASGGVELLIHSLATSVLDRGDWSVSGPGRFAREELKFLYINCMTTLPPLCADCLEIW